MRCICDWPKSCGGSGIIYCEGCGGDICICRCGGEDECPGCPDCNDGRLEQDSDREMFGDEPARFGLKDVGNK